MSKLKENVLSVEALRFLSLLPDKLPALLYRNEVGWILGLSQVAIKILTDEGLLRKADESSKSTRPMYAAVDILSVRSDVQWIHRTGRPSIPKTTPVP
jgi:hypothetical protein